jgi:Ca2+-transporting ATPase
MSCTPKEWTSGAVSARPRRPPGPSGSARTSSPPARPSPAGTPADGRLLKAATLEVDESALTGESLPVAKGTEPVAGAGTPLGDRTDMVYMNTNVTRGAGEFVITATGMTTEVGRISGMLNDEQAVKTPLTRQMDRLTGQILVIAGIALIASMALNLARGETFIAVFNAAVAFAIAAIPVGLPTVVTTILAWGTQQLAKAGAIMKRLASTQTLGSTSAINSDKTGTLTLNQMTAVQMTTVGRRYAVEGKGYSTAGRITRVGGQADIALDEFLVPMVLASDAVVRDGELVGDPTEGALVVLAAKGGIDAVSTRDRYPRIAELPFDAAYKLMATFHKMTGASGKEVIRCFVKGAPDQLLPRAATVVDTDAGPAPADGEFRQRYLAENQRLGQQGLRVIATARKDFDPAAFDPGADLLPLVTGLELLALVGIVDPPRPTAKTSIATAKAAGIRIRMITGDYAVTAAAVADELGIDGTVLTGAEFGAMSDEEALAKIDDIGVIARVTPEHKVRLVDVLRKKGQIVAMTGDGVNDAPAVKKADIGIAMGITGTEVTKEAAVMILTDDNFSTIVKAIELGRGLYDNLARYVRFQIGGLFGYIITFLGAAIFNIAQGIPLLPLQTLWVSFTMLSIQSVGLGYSKPAAGLMERPPLPPSPADPDPRPHRLARLGRPADGGRHPQRDQLGGAGARARHRPDHGHGHVRAVRPVLLNRVQRPTGLGVLPRHLLRQDVRHHDQRILRPAGPVHRAGHLPDRDKDRQARRPAVADLRRRGPVDGGGRRDPQSGAATDRREGHPPRRRPVSDCQPRTWVAFTFRIQPARNSSRRRAIGHAPSELLEITVQVSADLGSCTLRNETPASNPSKMTLSLCCPSQKPRP